MSTQRENHGEECNANLDLEMPFKQRGTKEKNQTTLRGSSNQPCLSEAYEQEKKTSFHKGYQPAALVICCLNNEFSNLTIPFSNSYI